MSGLPSAPTLLAFAGLAFGLAVTPGPNMAYLISCSIRRGRWAGLVSLGGIALGYVFYLLCAVTGVAAMLLAQPRALVLLKLAGAAYLAVLAVRLLAADGLFGRPPAQHPPESRGGLFLTGFLTNLLNPGVALLYLTLLPLFVVVEARSIWLQSLTLGSVHIVIGLAVNAAVALTAGSLAGFLIRHPGWLRGQRWITSGALAVFSAQILAALC